MAADREVTLGDLLAFLWQSRLRLLAATFISAAVAVYCLASFTKNTYQAMSTVRLDAQDINVVDVEQITDQFSVDKFLLNTELRVLQSPKILQDVIDRLDLEHNPAFLQGSGSAVFIKALRKLILGTDETAPKGKPTRRDIVEAVRAVLDVKLVRETYIFEIRVETTSPKLSVDIANAVADAYVRNQLREKLASSDEASVWLKSELEILSKDLLTADRQIARLRAILESVSEKELQDNADQIRQMRVRLADLHEQRDVLRVVMAPDRPALTEDASGAVLSFIEPVVGELGALQAEDGEDVIGRDQRLQRLEFLNRQINSLERTLNGLTDRISNRAADLNRLKELERAQSNTRALHEKFSNRLRETALQSGLMRPDARLLDYAKLPNQPSGPRWLRTIILVTTGGTVFAALLVILFNLLDPAVRSPQEWARLNTVALLAELPRLRESRFVLRRPVAKSNRSIAMRHCFSELRTKLMRRLTQTQGVIMVTGCGLRSDHPMLAARLAGSFAALPGKRVLLIDLDVQDQTLSRLLPASGGAPTLSDMLEFADAGWNAPIANVTAFCDERLSMDYLPVGTSSETPLDVMAGDAIRELLQECRQRYDWVVTSLPVVERGEIVPLAAEMSDHTLFAVNCPTAQRRVMVGLRSLLGEGSAPLSPVLTNVRHLKYRDRNRLTDLMMNLKSRRMQV